MVPFLSSEKAYLRELETNALIISPHGMAWSSLSETSSTSSFILILPLIDAVRSKQTIDKGADMLVKVDAGLVRGPVELFRFGQITF